MRPCGSSSQNPKHRLTSSPLGRSKLIELAGKELSILVLPCIALHPVRIPALCPEKVVHGKEGHSVTMTPASFQNAAAGTNLVKLQMWIPTG